MLNFLFGDALVAVAVVVVATLRECHCTTSAILQISVVEFDV